MPAVHVRPAWESSNPYTGLFADALVGAGLDVRGLKKLPAGPAVLVFHWPDEFFVQPRNPMRAARVLLALLRLRLGKWLSGQRIIWVAHNVTPHGSDPAKFSAARRSFFGLVDGLVFLSRSSRAEVIASYPSLRDLPHVILPHGIYPHVGRAPSTAPPAAGRAVRLALAGLVKRYKNPELAARLTEALQPEEAHLLIAGACDDATLRSELEGIAARAAHVELRWGYLDDAELEAAIDESDALLLPYRQILNSGSALLALSRFRPVIAPHLGSLPELRDQVGDDWLWLYEGELDEPKLRSAIAWLRARRPDGPPDLSLHDWAAIGRSAARFIRQLVEQDPTRQAEA